MKNIAFMKSEKIQLFIFCLIYHFFILLNFEGIYWDDWVLYNVDVDSVNRMFAMAGSNVGQFHSLILTIDSGVLLYRALLFLGLYLSALSIYSIIKLNYFKEGRVALIIAAIYLVLPLNSAKVALINTLPFLLVSGFFIAFYLLDKYIHSGSKVWYRITSLILFFISFEVSSLLLFYSVVGLHILVCSYRVLDDVSVFSKIYLTIKNTMLKYFDFMLLPIAFYILKINFFIPYGLYEGYNKMSFNVERIVSLLNNTLYTSIYEPVLLSFETAFLYWPQLSLVLFVLFFFTFIKKGINVSITNESVFLLISFGVFLFLIATVPYLMVNKLPNLWVWESRHQILMPLGIAFFIAGVISALEKINKHMAIFILTLFITVFSVQNIRNGYGYIWDWYYQVAIEEKLLVMEVVRDSTTFVVKDELVNKLANKRQMSFYEYNGHLKNAFGDETRLMVNRESDIAKYKPYLGYKEYNFSSWVYETPIYLVIRSADEKKINVAHFCNLLYLQFTDNRKFIGEVSQLVDIQLINK